MKQGIPLALLGVGFVLLVLSTFWVKIAPPTAYWSLEDEETLKEMNNRIVAMYNQLGQVEAKRLEARLAKQEGTPSPYEQAILERNAFRRGRDIAMTRPKQITAALRWSGLGAMAVGVVAYYVMDQLKKQR